MDATPLFSWGEERMHAKPLHLSSGPQVFSTLLQGPVKGLFWLSVNLPGK